MNIFKNYDMEKIKMTYLKYLIFYSNLSEESFTCLKLSFISFTSMKPFYGLDEMICASINIGLNDGTFYQAKKNLLCSDTLMAKVCNTIQKTDISVSDLMTHQDHKIKIGSSNLIHYCATHGSSELNIAIETQYARAISIVYTG